MKLQAGDKIIITNALTDDYYHNGDEGTLMEIDELWSALVGDGTLWKVKIGTISLWVMEAEFELAEIVNSPLYKALL